MKVKKRAPIDAKTFHQICSLHRDNCDAKDCWIITDGDHVTVCQQEDGNNATASVSLPRKEFNRLIRWYVRPQKVKR